MLRCAAAWILVAVSLAAQDTGSVEGRLINSVIRTGIPGAMVTITAAGGTRYAYNATTDRTGAFRVAGIPPGNYTASFRAEGFVNPPRRDPAMRIFSVIPGSPVRLAVELVPFAKISGRVLDAAGNPAANVHVEIMHPYGSYGIVSGTDARGYVEAPIPAGKYTLMARPVQKSVNLEKGVRQEDLMKLAQPPDDGERKTWVPTWYPNALDPRDAETIFARGGMDLSGYNIRFFSAYHPL
jgi:Carboxypeptidase regulatory-like domain